MEIYVMVSNELILFSSICCERKISESIFQFECKASGYQSQRLHDENCAKAEIQKNWW